MDKRKEESKLDGLKSFLYNSDTGEACGRTGSSWAQIGLFYLVYYSCLAGFFACMLALFFTTVNSNYPVQQHLNSILKENPGMGFRPQPDIETTLIRFEQGKPESYGVYTKHIHAYLDNYENENQEGENYIDCTNLAEEDRDEDKVCKFDLNQLGEEDDDCIFQNEYGYEDGQPCVLLKLNKIYDWRPKLYNNETHPPESAGLGDRWDEDWVAVNCEGENPADAENMGEIEFHPALGFHKRYFPYLNQEGYRQPLVFVQFKNPKNGVLIQVTCKVWVQGITHNRNDKAGSIHFELMVD